MVIHVCDACYKAYMKVKPTMEKSICSTRCHRFKKHKLSSPIYDIYNDCGAYLERLTCARDIEPCLRGESEDCEFYLGQGL